MLTDCSATNVPLLVTIEDECNGERKSTKCVYSEVALAALSLGANSTLKQIIDALLVVIEDLQDRVTILEA